MAATSGATAPAVGVPRAAPPAWRDFGADCRAEEVGLDQHALDRLRPLLQGWVAAGTMPMATALVARRGKVAWWGGCGEQSAGKDIAADTIYRIYSMTKPVVSVAIMKLVEEGRLLLETPLHVLLGKSWHRKSMKVFIGGTKDSPQLEECKKNITVWNLITHTAGLTYSFAGTEAVNPVAGMYQDAFGKIAQGMVSVEEASVLFAGVQPQSGAPSLAGLVDKLASLPLCFQPGSRWHYGFHFEVLGRIVEVVSGQSLGEFLEQRIFAPLGMCDTGFAVPPSKTARFAGCWYSSFFGGTGEISELQKQAGEYIEGRVTVQSGGGGLVSTMRDYFRFAQCMLNGGVGENGARILSRRTVEWITSNHLPGNTDMLSVSLPGYTEMSRPGAGFGLGLSVTLDPVLSGENVGAGTFGWGGLAGTVFFLDPTEQLCVIFMTQVIGLNPLLQPTRLLLSHVVSGAVVDGPPRPWPLRAAAAAAPRSKL